MLVDDEQHHVNRDQSDDQRGKQHDVQHVQAGDDVVTGEFSAEEEEGNPGTDSGDCLDHAVDDAKTVTREQVVGERVTRESFGHCEDEENESDDPVDFARLAECAGEEHAEHVQTDCGDEQQRGPVVNLAHEKSATNVERQVERRRICRGHVNSLEWDVRAVVINFDHGRVVEERQERSGKQDDDERVQRNFAEHERPVVRENFASEELDRPGKARAFVEVVCDATDYAHSASGGSWN